MEKVILEKFTTEQMDDEGKDYGMENVSWQTIMAPLKDVKNVLIYRQKPPNISLVYLRNSMRLLGILPRFWKSESLYYIVIFIFVMAMFFIFAVTITCDLYDASKDILQFGEDLVFLIGIYLIIFKLMLAVYYSKDIEQLICEFCRMHNYFSQLKKSPSHWKIRKLQRIFFLVELMLLFFFTILSSVFSAVLCLCPILTQSGTIPFRAKFPFVLESFSENPILFSSIYFFQSIMTLFCLQTIVVIDALGCHIFNHTTLNLKIFCILVRELGCVQGENRLEELHNAIKFHQYLINLITKINNVYYYNFASQMAASTLMICLTAFEAMLAQDNAMLAMKFQLYMFSAFLQLFYWCCAGSMVYYSSLDIAEAAYDIDRWYEQSEEFAYCLRFLMQRAQKPLIFRPKPFFCLNFDSFVSILSTSYSYFALLRTMNE